MNKKNNDVDPKKMMEIKNNCFTGISQKIMFNLIALLKEKYFS